MLDVGNGYSKKGDDMNREDPAIPEGWEQVPGDQKLQVGDMYWHPWRLKWEDYDMQYQLLDASDYYNDGSMVIRKKVTT